MRRSLRFAWVVILSALLLLALTWSGVGRAQESVKGQNELTVAQAAAGLPRENFVPGRILLKFRAGTSDAHADALLAAYGARTASRIAGTGVRVVELPSTAIEEHFVQTFSALPDVEFAELDRILQPEEITPNDPLYAGNEWHLPRISAPTAWGSTTGTGDVTVAILDTGVDGTHEDLASKMVAGWNTYNNNSDTSDAFGHGTKVAGAAAAGSNNATGVASVAWGCRVMPIRVSDTNGNASYSAIANGLTWAADRGARVANISYIVSDSSTVTSSARYFQSKGGVVTSSAGNYSTFSSSADNPYILTVSATDYWDVLSGFSNTGNNIDVAAPEAAYTTVSGGGYAYVSGTSISAPIVAGVAALVLSANPSLTPAQVQDIIKQSADDLGTPGWDSSYGWGRVNAARAVSAAMGGGAADTSPPAVSIMSPSNGATVSGTLTIQVSADDNVGVTSVSLSVDGGAPQVDAGSPYEFLWDTSTVANGSHTLVATAQDAAGNTSSSSVTVTVSNAPPTDAVSPTVTITSPAEGAKVSASVSVLVSAGDNVGVVKNELYVDGLLTSTSTSAPFTNKWNARKASAGAHRLQCKAYDAAGNVGLSQIVTVYR